MKYSAEGIPVIYSFWFDNRNRKIKNLKRNFILKGPNSREISSTWDWNLEDDYVCLYIGKKTIFKKRLGLHLLLKTKNLYEKESNLINKKTTTCQLRSGFDFLYQKAKKENIIEELEKRILISIIEIDDVIERFYLENYLIGHFKPWFNIDSER